MSYQRIQSFKDLKVWTKSSDLAVLTYKITKNFPASELYGLSNQMRRAVISISSNIAEGFKRAHKKEKLQFYTVSYSSAAELESQIEISNKLGYLSEQDYQKILPLTIEVAKMTDGLIKSVRRPAKFNSALIFLLISLYSIFYILYPQFVRAAALYLLPQSQTIYQGDSFLVDVRLNTEGREINAAQINLLIPDILEVIDFNKGNSLLSLWAQEPEAEQGKITLVGGTPQGFSGEGTIIKITFRAKEEGIAQVNFQESSKVLLNDGQGTQSPLVFIEGNYNILERPEKIIEISSKTHPEQDKWYFNNAFLVHWDLVEGSVYSYLLSHDALVIPDEIPDRPEGELMWLGDMEYYSLEDGIYYFHLREGKENEAEIEWGPVFTYRFMIDKELPEEFVPKIGRQDAVFGGKYFVSFSAMDNMSGIDRYEVLETRDSPPVGGESWKIAESPYLLEDQTLGGVIKVKAVDKAGNERIVEILPAKEEKEFPYWMIIIGPIMFLVVWWIWKKLKVKTPKRET